MLRTRVAASMAAVEAAAWNTLDLRGRPFLRHEFLLAAEQSGSACPETGWTPAHVLVERDGVLAGAAPLYLKTHSWGEFVFDFAWARAYEQHGLAYYPKLVAACPFTPAAGPRLIVRPGEDAPAVRAALLEAMDTLMHESGASSVHALFVEEDEREFLGGRGYAAREHRARTTDLANGALRFDQFPQKTGAIGRGPRRELDARPRNGGIRCAPLRRALSARHFGRRAGP